MSSLQGNVARRVVSGSLWMIGSQALVLVLMFIAQREILSSLSKEANGVLFFQRRVIDFLMIVLVDLGMNGILVRRIVHEQHRVSEILSSAIALRLSMALVATILGAVVAIYNGYSPVDSSVWAVYVFISARTTIGRYVLELPFRTTGRFNIVSALGVLDAVLFTIGIWLVREELSPSMVILVYAAAALPGFLVMGVARKEARIRPKYVSVGEMRSLLLESLPIVISVGLIAVHTILDTVLLETFGSARDVGILGAVYAAVGPFLVMIPQAVSLAFMPEIARQSYAVERRDASIVAMLRVLVVISACCAAAGVPLLPMFVDLVSSGRYSTDIEVFVWFLWSAPLVAIVVFVQEVAVTLGHQRRNIAIAGVLVLATAIFGILWIPGMLSLGAVVARLSTLAVGAIYCVWLLYRFMAKPVDLWVVTRIMMVIGGSIGVSYALTELPIAPLIASAGALLGTCGLAVVVRLVGADDLRQVRSRLRSDTPSS